MKEIQKSIKQNLRSRFENACESYRHALEKMWDLNTAYGYWIGDEIGGVYDNDGFVTLNLLDMIYCIENDISYKEYDEWTEYNIKAHEFNFNFINLKSWHMGCPRVSEETFVHLRKMKKDMADAIEAEKNKF